MLKKLVECDCLLNFRDVYMSWNPNQVALSKRKKANILSLHPTCSFPNGQLKMKVYAKKS